MFTIKQGYTNKNNQTYNNIRDIHFEKLGDLQGNVGKLTAVSHEESDDTAFIKPSSVYIYKSKYDPKKALRIYDDYGHYKYTYHADDKFISNLQSRQSKVKLTEFPTGIVSVENIIIGQEIPYYDNCYNILEMFKSKTYKKIPTKYYIEMLKIIKEMYYAGVLYKDIHEGNFLVDKQTEQIHLIDFDDMHTWFDYEKGAAYEAMVGHFKYLVNKLNKIENIEFLENFSKTKTLEEVEESLLENQKRLIK